MRLSNAALVLASLTAACAATQEHAARSESSSDPGFEIRAGKPVEAMPGEVRLRNIRQLTFGGENAEAYWSFDGRRLIMQRTHKPKVPCDQIFVIDLETGNEQMVSTGKGRTTCAYYLLGDQEIVYASTHLADPNCPPPVMRMGGKYVWAIYDGYDIFLANPDGSDLKRLTDTPGYDAEATVCPVTGQIVFTSVRDGDLELYSMDPDGGNVVRLTNRPGYDGGAFYSHDGTKLVQRSGFFASEEEKKEYFDLLRRGLVQPNKMEITVLDRDGSNLRMVTHNGKANFGPFWHPDNRRILFSSNQDDPRGRNFELYLIDEDGQNQEQVTHNPTFDGFPMFSPDGRYLVFASNRHGGSRGETNVFVAEWVEKP